LILSAALKEEGSCGVKSGVQKERKERKVLGVLSFFLTQQLLFAAIGSH
jgi:hypothetical protein